MNEPMTARQLFALAADNQPEMYARWSIVERNMPEVEQYTIDFAFADRMIVRSVHDHSFDGNRGWNLQAVYLDERPVMICQSAGRSGKDHQDRFIVDAGAFGELVGYLASLDTGNSDFIDLDEPKAALTDFYGYDLQQMQQTPQFSYPE